MVTLNALIVEEDDGRWSAQCPDLGIIVTGSSSEEAAGKLRAACEARVKDAGQGKDGGPRLKQVKCIRFKVEE